MNLLTYNKGKKLLKYGGQNPHVNITNTFTFGDLLNIWSKDNCELDNDKDVFERWFIRDDHYFSHYNLFVHLSNIKYDRHLVQTYMENDDLCVPVDEVFIPTFEDMFEHTWYELNID